MSKIDYPHTDLVVAWLNGETLQYYNNLLEEWEDREDFVPSKANYHVFPSANAKYHIKPKTVVKYYIVAQFQNYKETRTWSDVPCSMDYFTTVINGYPKFLSAICTESTETLLGEILSTRIIYRAEMKDGQIVFTVQ